MRFLTKQEFKEEAESRLKQVFQNYNDLINECFFRPEITDRTIIYPCYGSFELLTLDTIINAAMNLGDKGCYLWNFWTITGVECEHCFVYLSELKRLYFYEFIPEKLTEKFLKFRARFNSNFTDGCIYSETGKWGIWKCHEGFGILGGPQEFLAEIRQKIPDIDSQVYGLLWEFNNSGCLSPNSAVLSWLPGLLNHVYGSEVAERILEDIRTGSI